VKICPGLPYTVCKKLIAYINRLQKPSLVEEMPAHISYHIIHKTSESRWITFIFSLILSIPVFYLSPLLSVCIVDVLSSDFLYGTALLVLTYTLITQTARNPFLSPLPHQPFSSLFVYVCLCIPGCLFGRTFLYTRLSWIETGDVCCCVSNGVALSGFACACFGSRRR